jgi:hypothetical protein
MFVMIILPLILAIGLGTLIGYSEDDGLAGFGATVVFICAFGMLGATVNLGICDIREEFYNYNTPTKSISNEITCDNGNYAIKITDEALIFEVNDNTEIVEREKCSILIDKTVETPYVIYEEHYPSATNFWVFDMIGLEERYVLTVPDVSYIKGTYSIDWREP